MREEFIKAATQEEAERLAPWAEGFFPRDGGYDAYEYLENGVEMIAERRISPIRLIRVREMEHLVIDSFGQPYFEWAFKTRDEAVEAAHKIEKSDRLYGVWIKVAGSDDGPDEEIFPAFAD